MTQKSPRRPQALLFDVQGTATDFHSTVCGEAVRISAGRCPKIDWAHFISRWRSEYFTAIQVLKPDRDSHKYDIRAAARLGFQTAFVARPTENGPDETVDISYSPEFDINARDFLDLASQLGC